MTAATFNRRQVLRAIAPALAGLGTALGPSAVRANDKPRRLAVVSPSYYSADEIRDVVLPELARRGFAAGQNLVVTFHIGALADLPRLAQEAAATKPEVVLASTNWAAQAVMAELPATPIVLAFGGDAVAGGLARSLARPGGMLTGLTMMTAEMDNKRLSLLAEALPSVKRIGVLVTGTSQVPDERHEIVDAAKALGLAVHIHRMDAAADYAAGVAAFRAFGAEALLAASSPEHTRDTAIIARLAIEARLPSMGGSALMGRGGCLLGYGPSTIAFRRRAADFVVRILNGTPPSELPMEQPTEFDLVVNLKTAAALGLTLPPAILVRATEVIE